jgi:hypothetical protein
MGVDLGCPFFGWPVLIVEVYNGQPTGLYTFSSRSKRIWLEGKKHFLEQVAQKPTNIGL